MGLRGLFHLVVSLETKAHQNHAGKDDEEAEQFEQHQEFDPLDLSGECGCHHSTGFHHVRMMFSLLRV